MEVVPLAQTATVPSTRMMTSPPVLSSVSPLQVNLRRVYLLAPLLRVFLAQLPMLQTILSLSVGIHVRSEVVLARALRRATRPVLVGYPVITEEQKRLRVTALRGPELHVTDVSSGFREESSSQFWTKDLLRCKRRADATLAQLQGLGHELPEPFLVVGPYFRVLQ